MPRYPRSGFPFQYYRPYAKNNFYNNYIPHTPPLQSASSPQPTSPPPIASEEPQKSENRASKKPNSEDTVWLDLFGIKLYFDDVLILSLLFFLYKEEVKDEGLFLALVLLLIS